MKTTLVIKVHESSTKISLALKGLKMMEARFFSKVSKKVASTIEGIKSHIT
jgi:hypothetical protein